MNKLSKELVTGLIIGLVLGATAGYFLHNIINRNFIRERGNFGNLQIDDNKK